MPKAGHDIEEPAKRLVESDAQALVLAGELRINPATQIAFGHFAEACRQLGDDTFGPLAFGDVVGELDDLDELALRIKDRIIGRIDPDFSSALAETLKLGRNDFTSTQAFPELGVLGRAGIGRIAKHAVVLADDFVECIPDRLEQIVVGLDDGAIEIEFDHGLNPAECCGLCLMISGAIFLLGDIGRELDDLDRLARAVEHRIIAGLDPNLTAALADAAISSRLELAGAEISPELLVFG